MKKSVIILLAGAIFLGACGGGTTAPAPSPAQPGQPATTSGDPAKGQQTFSAVGCAACHGAQAQGGVIPGATKLANTALAFDDVKKQVRTPKDPSKGMPPFTAAQVSDAQLGDIYAWLKSLR